ncbi:hypothetical protein EX30DRAFT_373603 [Ascodesmis nigricans]|uniref:Uncharacterized protein n=1 Tax=Ascodesmis nigricans TaxID=341454 RepID=A0A4S2MNL7_9PEZI|nr:hypothetical protein EX30DRAFT_373603 [Ascodesmis nigricans]
MRLPAPGEVLEWSGATRYAPRVIPDAPADHSTLIEGINEPYGTLGAVFLAAWTIGDSIRWERVYATVGHVLGKDQTWSVVTPKELFVQGPSGIWHDLRRIPLESILHEILVLNRVQTLEISHFFDLNINISALATSGSSPIMELGNTETSIPTILDDDQI